MNRIKKLSLHEAHKIAAGEVVERPANVVKELLENALDAGATVITVYLDNAGKDLIRVVDNGCGMSPDDARMCIEQYATSKITSVDELATIDTFGFRGEALASIAAVSHCTLITKQADSTQGIELTITDGTIQSQTIVGCNTGTDISIRNLLHNVPARRKFLRTRATEWHQIYTLIQAVCLNFQAVHMSVWHDGVQVLNCPAVPDIHSRLVQLWDHTFAQQMLTLDTHQAEHGIRVTGVTSLPTYGRYDRSHIIFFVNGRWIKNHQLAQALIKGYAQILPPGRYPAACVFLQVNQHEVDINIHPRKEEVLFLHPRHVEQAIQHAVTAALEKQAPQTLQVRAAHIPVPEFFTNRPYGEKFIPESVQRPATNTEVPANYTSELSLSGETVRPEQTVGESKDVEVGPVLRSLPSSKARISEVGTQQPITDTPHITIIGQYKNCYILIEHDDALCLVDQHAAHERIMYEQLSTRFQSVATVPLLFPHMITVNTADRVIIEPYLDIYSTYGIDISVFNDTQLIVRAIPVHAKDVSMHDLVSQTIAWIREYASLDVLQVKKVVDEKLRAQMACKAAIKAGDVLDMQQMEQLLVSLHKTNNRLSCPHGRPTQWLLPHYEIEKKFKRKL